MKFEARYELCVRYGGKASYDDSKDILRYSSSLLHARPAGFLSCHNLPIVPC